MITALLFGLSIFVGNIYQRAAVAEDQQATVKWRMAYEVMAVCFYALGAWWVREGVKP